MVVIQALGRKYFTSSQLLAAAPTLEFLRIRWIGSGITTHWKDTVRSVWSYRRPELSALVAEVLWASIVCEHIIFFLWLVILLWVPNDPAFLAKKRALDKFEAEMYARPWAKASATWDSEDDEDDDEDAEVDDKSLQININLIAADGEKNSEVSTAAE